MALIESKEKKNYISILGSDATLRKVVPEGTTGAVTRIYKDSKDAEHTKIEKVYESVSGLITDIVTVDTEYGTLLQVTLTDTDEFLPSEPEVLSMSTSSEFGTDFMKKLPNIDLAKVITVRPYKFTPEDAKRELKGLSITQDGNKIEKSFVEKQGDVWVNTMGYPTPDEKTKNEKNEMKRKEYWKRYFSDCQMFLVEYTNENFVSKFNKKTVDEILDDEVKIPDDY